MSERDRYFSIPQVLVICAFVAALSGLSGWVLNIEIRKADRSEIVGKSYQDTVSARLGGIEYELRYIRDRLDKHMTYEVNGKVGGK